MNAQSREKAAFSRGAKNKKNKKKLGSETVSLLVETTVYSPVNIKRYVAIFFHIII